MFVPSPPMSGFEHTMQHFSNQTLWVLIDYSGDGCCILNEMIAQSLVIIHNGSYMKEVSPNICSVATMIYCTIAKAWCKCTWAERSSSAGPYREKFLRGLMMQLILNAAASAYHGVIPLVVVDCDNNGVVSHGNAPLCSLPTNQAQADVLCTFKHLVSAQSFHVIFNMQLHANDTKKWWDCTLKEGINIEVDRLAKKALKAAHSTRQFIKGTFLHKQIWITMGGKMVTGPLWSELEEF